MVRHMVKLGGVVLVKRRQTGFRLSDAFPTKSGAKASAKDFRAQKLYGNVKKFLARVKDMGRKAGRLRYGVYVKEMR